MISLNNKRDRGQRAKVVLENDLFIEAFGIVESDIKKLWEDPRSTPDARERLWNMLQGLVSVKEVLEKVLWDGKTAEKEISRQTKK